MKDSTQSEMEVLANEPIGVDLSSDMVDLVQSDDEGSHCNSVHKQGNMLESGIMLPDDLKLMHNRASLPKQSHPSKLRPFNKVSKTNKGTFKKTKSLERIITRDDSIPENDTKTPASVSAPQHLQSKSTQRNNQVPKGSKVDFVRKALIAKASRQSVGTDKSQQNDKHVTTQEQGRVAVKKPPMNPDVSPNNQKNNDSHFESPAGPYANMRETLLKRKIEMKARLERAKRMRELAEQNLQFSFERQRRIYDLQPELRYEFTSASEPTDQTIVNNIDIRNSLRQPFGEPRCDMHGNFVPRKDTAVAGINVGVDPSRRHLYAEKSNIECRFPRNDNLWNAHGRGDRRASAPSLSMNPNQKINTYHKDYISTRKTDDKGNLDSKLSGSFERNAVPMDRRHSHFNGYGNSIPKFQRPTNKIPCVEMQNTKAPIHNLFPAGHCVKPVVAATVDTKHIAYSPKNNDRYAQSKKNTYNSHCQSPQLVPTYFDKRDVIRSKSTFTTKECDAKHTRSLEIQHGCGTVKVAENTMAVVEHTVNNDFSSSATKCDTNYGKSQTLFSRAMKTASHYEIGINQRKDRRHRYSLPLRNFDPPGYDLSGKMDDIYPKPTERVSDGKMYSDQGKVMNARNGISGTQRHRQMKCQLNDHNVQRTPGSEIGKPKCLENISASNRINDIRSDGIPRQQSDQQYSRNNQEKLQCSLSEKKQVSVVIKSKIPSAKNKCLQNGKIQPLEPEEYTKKKVDPPAGCETVNTLEKAKSFLRQTFEVDASLPKSNDVKASSGRRKDDYDSINYKGDQVPALIGCQFQHNHISKMQESDTEENIESQSESKISKMSDFHSNITISHQHSDTLPSSPNTRLSGINLGRLVTRKKASKLNKLSSLAREKAAIEPEGFFAKKAADPPIGTEISFDVIDLSESPEPDYSKAEEKEIFLNQSVSPARLDINFMDTASDASGIVKKYHNWNAGQKTILCDDKTRHAADSDRRNDINTKTPSETRYTAKENYSRERISQQQASRRTRTENKNPTTMDSVETRCLAPGHNSTLSVSEINSSLRSGKIGVLQPEGCMKNKADPPIGIIAGKSCTAEASSISKAAEKVQLKSKMKILVKKARTVSEKNLADKHLSDLERRTEKISNDLHLSGEKNKSNAQHPDKATETESDHKKSNMQRFVLEEAGKSFGRASPGICSANEDTGKNYEKLAMSLQQCQDLANIACLPAAGNNGLDLNYGASCKSILESRNGSHEKQKDKVLQNSHAIKIRDTILKRKKEVQARSAAIKRKKEVEAPCNVERIQLRYGTNHQEDRRAKNGAQQERNKVDKTDRKIERKLETFVNGSSPTNEENKKVYGDDLDVKGEISKTVFDSNKYKITDSTIQAQWKLSDHEGLQAHKNQSKLESSYSAVKVIPEVQNKVYLAPKALSSLEVKETHVKVRDGHNLQCNCFVDKIDINCTSAKRSSHSVIEVHEPQDHQEMVNLEFKTSSCSFVLNALNDGKTISLAVDLNSSSTLYAPVLTETSKSALKCNDNTTRGCSHPQRSDFRHSQVAESNREGQNQQLVGVTETDLYENNVEYDLTEADSRLILEVHDGRNLKTECSSPSRNFVDSRKVWPKSQFMQSISLAEDQECLKLKTCKNHDILSPSIFFNQDSSLSSLGMLEMQDVTNRQQDGVNVVSETASENMFILINEDSDDDANSKCAQLATVRNVKNEIHFISGHGDVHANTDKPAISGEGPSANALDYSGRKPQIHFEPKKIKSKSCRSRKPNAVSQEIKRAKIAATTENSNDEKTKIKCSNAAGGKSHADTNASHQQFLPPFYKQEGGAFQFKTTINKKFSVIKDYNLEMTEDEAFQLQEKLFREAAEKVRANTKVQIVEHDDTVRTENPRFAAPLNDIAERYPDHWRWKDPYAILGLPQKASVNLVKSAYRKLALKYHPDRQISAELQHSTTKFHAISKAYQKITNIDL